MNFKIRILDLNKMYNIGDTIVYKKHGKYILAKIIKIKDGRYVKDNGKSIKEKQILFSVEEALAKNLCFDCERCCPTQCSKCFNYFKFFDMVYCEGCSLALCDDCNNDTVVESWCRECK